ncbi:ion channel [Aurantiacibacter poecillastricola]|uniref:ion channel n=1 Tax=Aurantiacibacter poecillastricola TaxID=3064385 RepID=UPI00273DC52C|nr:ion channel [Aurantiacibacter sp. 219JJ12-13]MDP5261778.1 ion channel [Aurantiacibacter sp. 219JJ12-13]
MDLLLSFVLALATVCLTGALHLALLGNVARSVMQAERPKWQRFQAILLTATVGQTLAALLFALAFAFFLQLGFGHFREMADPGFGELFTFSMVNLTTLGLGDMIPLGPLKFLAGIEAMTGFLLISCSASHVFQVMRP